MHRHPGAELNCQDRPCRRGETPLMKAAYKVSNPNPPTHLAPPPPPPPPPPPALHSPARAGRGAA